MAGMLECGVLFRSYTRGDRQKKTKEMANGKRQTANGEAEKNLLSLIFKRLNLVKKKKEKEIQRTTA